jgi:membrane fusion protein, heavy metal efflux system
MDQASPLTNQVATRAIQPERGHLALVRRVAAVFLGLGALVGLGVAMFQILNRQDPATAPSAVEIRDGAVVMGRDAAQLRYLSVQVAEESEALAPPPAPARVTVDESRAAPVFASLAGRVEQVVVQLGQEVRPGARLLAIRSAGLPDLGRDIELARAGLSVKRTAVERVRDLVDLRAVPQKELLLAEQELREAEIALRTAEGKRRSLRIGGGGALDESGLYWVTAPRAGTVVERRALVGMEVGPDRDQALLTVADLDAVMVVADLLESDVTGIQPGQKALVTGAAPGESPAEGTVAYVADVVDPLRRTVAVRVRVPNTDRRLRPNAFAQVTFLPPPISRVVVATEAVVSDGQQPVAFVRIEDGSSHRFERRPVRVGRTRGGKTEILEGLKPGESYVERGALLLLNAIDLGG